jgi:hypothetical protein
MTDNVKKALEEMPEKFLAKYPETSNWFSTHYEAILQSLKAYTQVSPVVSGTREAVIDAVEQEMAGYDMPECEPSIAFDGKTVCELVDLAKVLMKENLELEQACHDRQLEIFRLQATAHHIPKTAGRE